MVVNKLFFELIRVAIGNQVCLSRTPSDAEWGELYAMAKKQSLVGICFAAVQKLTHNQEPITKNLNEVQYLQWMGMAAKIQQRNEAVNRQCIELVESLKLRGYRSCILKGQGIAALYKLRDESLELREAAVDAKRNSQLSANNSQLGKLRQSGDIDVYVDCGRVKAIEYARSIQDEVDWDYKHLHLKVFPDTEVEVHYRPEVLMNLRKNQRLQRWFEEHKDFMRLELRAECIENGTVDSASSPTKSLEIVTPAVEFNVFYILLHIYRHFLFEGVGLRQLMDYYFVLVAYAEHELPSFDRAQDRRLDHEFSINSLLNEFGMERFARGVMWIMQEVFGLEKEYLICSADEKEGRYILREVMEGGNFGHHDERIAVNVSGKKGSVLRILRHNWHLLAHYPSEALWAPIYFVCHFVWKKVRA